MPTDSEWAWGKTDRQNGWHDLAAHCLDVAAVFEALLAIGTLRRRINIAAGRPIGETDIARLSALVFLHDVGKLHPGFQAKGWPDPGGWAGRFVPHAGAGRGLVAQVCNDGAHPLRKTFEQVFDWSPGIEDLLKAAFAHHGQPVAVVKGAEGDWPDNGKGYSWRKAARHLDEWLQRAFPEAFLDGPSLPCAPAFVHQFAGLTALADWIGSNRDFFEFVPDPPADYTVHARRMARSSVAAIGLDPAALS